VKSTTAAVQVNVLFLNHLPITTFLTNKKLQLFYLGLLLLHLPLSCPQDIYKDSVLFPIQE
jgi:hypothetical protein